MARFQAGPTTGFYVLPLFTSILVNNFASTLNNHLLLAGAVEIHLLSICFFLFLLRIFSIVIFKIAKGIDIELILTLVNKKGSLQRIKAAKINADIRAILHLVCGGQMSP
jgi:hypothetical protein